MALPNYGALRDLIQIGNTFSLNFLPARRKRSTWSSQAARRLGLDYEEFINSSRFLATGAESNASGCGISRRPFGILSSIRRRPVPGLGQVSSVWICF